MMLYLIIHKRLELLWQLLPIRRNERENTHEYSTRTSAIV